MSRTREPGGDAPGSLVTPVLPRPGGRPWLVLPGWRQSGAHWTPLARWLTGSGVGLHAADLATAAARCDAPRGSLARTEEMAAALLAEPVAADAAIVVGHSAGTPLAALLAAALPGVAGLVLVEPVAAHFGAAPPRPPVLSEAVLAAGAGSLRRQYPLAAATTLRTIDAALRGQPRQAEDDPVPPTAATDVRRTERVREALVSARVPVLVVRGRASALLAAEHARILAGMAPKGRAVTLPDAGHSPHIDSPRATAAHLTAFAAEVAPHPPTHAGARLD
ncbi:alpha/beta hydrolase [Streptomyces sp. NPDC032940]|uniref:alpha/beta fold hydrolase n=1 Tax=Streptomyces sp. NPDC032940 TaxID=3155366 RepID=UPI0033F64115